MLDLQENSDFIQSLEKIIDAFILQLKHQLLSGGEPSGGFGGSNSGNNYQRGVWDRLKNWWHNLLKGRYDANNPYHWQNKLGDYLGRPAENYIPLSHYAILKEQANLLENSLPYGSEKLQIMKVIDDWAKQFKSTIMNLIDQTIKSNPTPQTQQTPQNNNQEESPVYDPLAEEPPQKPKKVRRVAPMSPEEIEPPIKSKKNPILPVEPNENQKELYDRLEEFKGDLSPRHYNFIKNLINNNKLDKAEDTLANLNHKVEPSEEQKELYDRLEKLNLSSHHHDFIKQAIDDNDLKKAKDLLDASQPEEKSGLQNKLDQLKLHGNKNTDDKIEKKKSTKKLEKSEKEDDFNLDLSPEQEELGNRLDQLKYKKVFVGKEGDDIYDSIKDLIEKEDFKKAKRMLDILERDKHEGEDVGSGKDLNFEWVDLTNSRRKFMELKSKFLFS